MIQDPILEEKHQMYNFMFIGERDNALLRFFHAFFDMNIEFSHRTGIFYYPYKLSNKILIRSFAAFQGSLETVLTPKQFKDTDCIVIVLNLFDNRHFSDFLPYFQTILEKKKYCPPIILAGVIPDTEKSREISYFGLIALKSFLSKKFKPKDIHYFEWNLCSGFNGKGVMKNLILDIKKVIDHDKQNDRANLSKARISIEIKKLRKELQEFKFLDKNQGLSYLIADERYRRYTLAHKASFFPGYTRAHLINRGLNRELVKDILDEWEELNENHSPTSNFIDRFKDKFPEFFDNVNGFLIPTCLSTLVAEKHVDVEDAKKFLTYLKERGVEIDLHDTQPIVEELTSINEIIVIYEGQPIFFYLPNKNLGFGSEENIQMLSGMIHVMDIMRNKVYVSEDDNQDVVEKIKYGSLKLAIAHGSKIKCIIHSLMELTEESLVKLEKYVNSFESKFEGKFDNYKGNVSYFNNFGKGLYHDIFTPLPLEHINKNWRLQKFTKEQKCYLTNKQQILLDLIKDLMEQGKIEKQFHLEDVFGMLCNNSGISLSDMMLLLPGELLK